MDPQTLPVEIFDWGFAAVFAPGFLIRGRALRTVHIKPTPGGVTKSGRIEMPQYGDSAWEALVDVSDEQTFRALMHWFESIRPRPCYFHRGEATSRETIGEGCYITRLYNRPTETPEYQVSLVRCGAPPELPPPAIVQDALGA